MRVISGSAKGRKLKSVPGDTTRPILDRVKEALFNILSEELPDSRWLDLFAGTGQVGIEALSRGAAEVVFVDLAKNAIRTISDNLKHCQLTERAELIRSDSFAILEQIKDGRWRGDKFDYIFVAPPQYQGLWLKAFEIIDSDPSKFLHENGEVIIQVDPHELRNDVAEDWAPSNLALVDERRYGRTLLLFYALSDKDEEDK